ncbi:MAG TPA: arginase [Spirochaetia bacterium]|nr:arginase [Spirochaetia bacterium]
MRVRLLGVAMDLGAGRRGVDMGPSAMRVAGIRERIAELGFEVEDDQESIFVPIRERGHEYNSKLKFLPEIVEGCTKLAVRVELAKDEGALPVVMGGDHSIAIGTIAGLAAHYRKAGKRMGVVWVDAHADFNTPESTPSGNIHGMPLAVSVGLGVPELTLLHGAAPKVLPEDVVLIGIRDVDVAEKQNLRDMKIRSFTMTDIDRIGMAGVIDNAISHLREQVDVIHVSFDVDSLDPEFAPGVGTPVAGGLQYRELHLLMETLAESRLIGSFEVVEVNPILDSANATAEVAVGAVCSALGKTIL